MVSPRIDQTHRGRKPNLSQVWQHSPVIPTLDRLRQEDYKFRSSLYLQSETLSRDTNHSENKNTFILWGDPDLEFTVSTSSDIFHTAAASAVLRSKTVQPQSHIDS